MDTSILPYARPSKSSCLALKERLWRMEYMMMMMLRSVLQVSIQKSGGLTRLMDCIHSHCSTSTWVYPLGQSFLHNVSVPSIPVRHQPTTLHGSCSHLDAFALRINQQSEWWASNGVVLYLPESYRRHSLCSIKSIVAPVRPTGSEWTENSLIVAEYSEPIPKVLWYHEHTYIRYHELKRLCWTSWGLSSSRWIAGYRPFARR